MPELPEVELTVKLLRNKLLGRKLKFAWVNRRKLIPENEYEDFVARLKSTRFETIERRAKYILMNFENGETLVIHLRMTGKFMTIDAESDEPKYTHAVFLLDNDEKLVFIDQRHFGFMKLISKDLLDDYIASKNLAPEPLSNEFTKSYFREMLHSGRRAIKSVLLDQKKVAGLGNIYASEALFLARVHPLTQACNISTIKSNRLFFAIRNVLTESIEYSDGLRKSLATIESSYFNGSDGWWVYAREGEPCKRCGTIIKRLKHSGRSSFFCPRCQIV